MKLLLFTVSVTALFTFSQCKKNKEEPQLPPETTIGAMTFGCKINGKVFVPRDGRGKPGLFVQYVNLGDGPGGGWYLNIPALDWKPAEIPGVSITTDSLFVVEGMSYDFKTTKGNVKAFYDIGSNHFVKLNDNEGRINITKHDTQNRILSGSFFFIGTDMVSGEKVSVTDGRFDIRY